MSPKIKIKKGDTVVVISGKDKGKHGRVLDVFGDAGRVVVEGIAIKKKHQRPRKAGQKGEVVSLPSPVHLSNVMLLCANCGKGGRAGYRIGETGTKTRVCKKCKNEL